MTWDHASLLPLEGGDSGETFLAESAGERTVVRIYAERSARRGPFAISTDAAVLRWVRGLLPTPEVLEVRQPDPTLDMPAVLVTTFRPGIRADLLLPTLDAEGRAKVGRQLASVLQRLSGIATPRPGRFHGPELVLQDPPAGMRDLPAWVASHQRALSHWSRSERAQLGKLAERAQEWLEPLDRSCLVHGDLHLRNLLLDSDSLSVTGVLDWELAHSGSPHADLGRLLRFQRAPDFVEAVLSRLEALELALGLPVTEGRLERARATDLFALVELATQREAHPLASASDALLRESARTGDLHTSLPPGLTGAP